MLPVLLAIAVLPAPQVEAAGEARAMRPHGPSQAGLCAAEAPGKAAWLFCDDFESSAPLVGLGRYFEVGTDGGEFAAVDGVGRSGSRGMRAAFQAGEDDAGSLKLAFGRNPNGYMAKQGIRPGEDFREIFYRLDLRHQAGWTGNPAKLSRITVFVSADSWAQAMIAHLWGASGSSMLGVDPASCVGADDRVRCATYNDFANLRWLGFARGRTPVFDTDRADRWLCIEHHVRLNGPGQADGLQEFWIDDQLEARREGLDFVHGFRAYGLNAIFLENYWNDGAIRDQERYFDNVVVSTERIGCEVGAEPTATMLAPTPIPSATELPSPSPTSTDPNPSTTPSAIHLPRLGRP